MQHFYSNGKLLLTGEYVVLDGAHALALPTTYGQSMRVETIAERKIVWKSVDFEGHVWFEDEFTITNNVITHAARNDDPVSKRLLQIFQAVKTFNPEFLSESHGFKIISTLEFPNQWGLGSSSTLLNNIATWAKVDAFELSHATFGGSGYDIACAQNDTAILYSIANGSPNIETLQFNKPFEDRLFFVHLNRKQDSRKSIQTYQDNKQNTNSIISEINGITKSIIETDDFETFQNAIESHELLIGKITNQTTIKQRLFSDYLNQIKSLGGWNGDFVLVTGHETYVRSYFKAKGYNTIISFNKMILNGK